MDRGIRVIWGKQGLLLQGRQIQKHCHSCFQLYYIISGEARFIVGDQPLAARAGTCFLIPPMTYHRMLPMEQDAACLDFKLLVQDGSLQALLAEAPPPLTDSGPILRQLTYAEQYWTVRDEATQQTLSELMGALLLSFCLDRLHPEEKPGSRHILTEGYSELTCAVLSHLERTYAYPFRLEELARALNYNKNYLSSAFRKNTGICIVDYLNFIRIRHAVICFVYYGQDVGLTCEVTGFSNLSHFSRTFKALTGLAPSVFRRAIARHSAEELSRLFADDPILNYRICTLEEALQSLRHIGAAAAELTCPDTERRNDPCCCNPNG